MHFMDNLLLVNIINEMLSLFLYLFFLTFTDVLLDINYFHCLQIVEILKETEADTKNVFGRYGSQRMKDWQEVVWLYEKDNLYLAEAAHLLISNVKYEVPNLKKHIAKCHQNQQVCLVMLNIT